MAEDEDYEKVALCPHVNGYFHKDTPIWENSVIKAECNECGWVSATAPHTKFRRSGFGFRVAADGADDPPSGIFSAIRAFEGKALGRVS